MSEAQIYLRNGNLFISAFSSSVSGFSFASSAPRVLEVDEPPARIGRELLAALEESQTDVPAPKDPKSISKPLLAACGVKTWAAFSKGAKCALITHDDSGWHFTPTRNLGARDGFDCLDKRTIHIDSTMSEQQIGEAAISVMEKSK